MFWILLVAVFAAAFKPFILPRILELNAWPLDESIGPIGVLSVEQLRSTYQGKRVLIFGGTRGVGFGIAQAVAQAGARVVVVGRNAKVGQAAIRELGEENSAFIQGDIGIVANAKATVDQIVEFVSQAGQEPFDYLVVTAAVFPDWSGSSQQQEDGIDIPFAVAVVGRYIVYKNMPRFLKSDARVMNVLGSGEGSAKVGISRDLASGQRNATSLFDSIATFGFGNELMMQLIDRDPVLSSYTRVSTHPGMLHTDLHRGQGVFFDVVAFLAVKVAGISVEECGLRQASVLACSRLHEKGLSFVSSDLKGRVASPELVAFTEENLPWLQEFLQKHS